MVKLQEVGGRFSLCVPRDVVRRLGWRKGVRLFAGVDDEGRLVYSLIEGAYDVTESVAVGEGHYEG